jgi:hypothetical protein
MLGKEAGMGGDGRSGALGSLETEAGVSLWVRASGRRPDREGIRASASEQVVSCERQKGWSVPSVPVGILQASPCSSPSSVIRPRGFCRILGLGDELAVAVAVGDLGNVFGGGCGGECRRTASPWLSRAR